MIPHLIGLLLIYAMNKAMTKATDIVIEKAIDITTYEVSAIATKIKNDTVNYMKNSEEEKK